MGDFNIIEFDKLGEFCNLFNLTNLITSPTCFIKTHKSTIGLILTLVKRKLFSKDKVTETGLSDFHKPISTFLRSRFSWLNPKTIYYRNYKKFNEQKVLKDVENTNFWFESDNLSHNYELITDLFSKIVSKYAPLEKKFLRGNQVPSINKEFRKVIFDRSRLRNKFCKTQTE